jgi:class 3 adenylate cyclase/tetratricopeptide (TPR) repeat protein
VSYRAVQRQFDLDDATLEDVKAELLYAHPELVMDEGRGLVWTGAAGPTHMPPASPPQATPPPAAVPVSDQVRQPDPAPLAYTPTHLTEKILAARPTLAGERKQVTVFFADIKDSTRLIEGLDPEAAQRLLDPAIHIMMHAVHRYEGTVNQVLGDGIMALFGAPIAHEDHALRACYAALALQSAMRPYAEEVRRTHGLLLQLRVGLNSGEVVVRAIGNDLHTDYSAVGQHTHLAARMEQLAAPGSILLTAATLRLVEGLVRVNTLGPMPVKGLTDPVEVFELLGASTLRWRFQAAAARGLTRFVGRQTELEVLRQALTQAGARHGQVVAVVGEAGVGKSRLVYEFTHSHHTPGWLLLESASVSYGKATAYFPVVDLLKRYCHIDDSDEPRTVRAKVTGQVLTLDTSLQEAIPALLSLLEVLPEDSPFLRLDPPQRRRHTLDALKRLLLRESQAQPVLLVCEDLHWIDSETQALFDTLVDSLPTVRLLLLVNYRPEYQHGWGSKTYYAQLRLDPLPPASAEDFLLALLGDDPSFVPLKQLLIARTEGNPFFLEESVRTLVETGVLVGTPGAYRLAQALPTIQVPATVQAVLAARIDRLPPEEKRLLQTAAVIGTEVPFALLQAIAELPEAELHRGLAHLQAAEFLYEASLFPDLGYTFKHALTHEVASSSLLLERRRVLHTRIVEALEALAPDRGAEQIERLAYHALRGEVWDKAVAYGRQAGVRAATRSAHREAVAYLEQALTALAQLPETRDTLEQAIDLRFDLRNALLPLDEPTRILDHLHAAEALAERLGDSERLGRIAGYLCFSFMAMGEHDRAIAAGQRALTLATTSGAFDIQVTTQTNLGQAYYAVGDFRQALDVLRQVIVLLTGEQRYARFGRLALPAVTSRGHAAWCLAELGGFVEGLSVAEEAVRLAETADQPYSIAFALMAVGLLSRRQEGVHTATPVLERGLALSQTTNIPLFFPMIASSLGAAYALAGQTSQALPLLDQALERVDTGSRLFPHALVLTELSEACLLVGRVDEAGALARHLLEISRSYTGSGYRAHACRLFGDVAIRREPLDVDQATAHYRQALVLAEELGMRPLQTHCHLGLGTLYGRMGRGEPACAELTAAIELYRAMDMTFWLPQAEAALAQAISG